MRDPMLLAEIRRNLGATNGGLKGISGLSGDVRDQGEEAAKGNLRADLALKALAYETQKHVGAYFLALDRLDVLMFTGGIGANSATVRVCICGVGLGCLGIELNLAGNRVQRGERVISTNGSPATVVVVAANKELVNCARDSRLPTAPAAARTSPEKCS